MFLVKMAQWLKQLSQGWDWWHSSVIPLLTGGDGRQRQQKPQKLKDQLDRIYDGCEMLC